VPRARVDESHDYRAKLLREPLQQFKGEGFPADRGVNHCRGQTRGCDRGERQRVTAALC
jgi:hypothetical protein